MRGLFFAACHSRRRGRRDAGNLVPLRPRESDLRQVAGPHKRTAPRGAGLSCVAGGGADQSLYASTGMQAHITFLSPCTLSTRATGGQYLTCLSTGSGNAASSRG